MKHVRNDQSRDAYELSTGRIVDANSGAIGIDNELNVSEGYDGGIYPSPDELTDGPAGLDPEQVWTQAEREELADYMIGLWTRWKAKARE